MKISSLRVTILIGLLLLVIHPLLAQKEDALWFCPNNVGLDFTDPLHPKVFDSQQRDRIMPAAISDAGGNLLFYLVTEDTKSKNPNGAYLNDGKHHTIKNSEGIYQGDSGIKGSFIIPVPNKQHEYYLFTCPTFEDHRNGNGIVDSFFFNLYMHHVYVHDTLSYVIRKNRKIHHGHLACYPRAVRHSNGIDWWIIGFDRIRSSFVSLMITGNDTILKPIWGIKYAMDMIPNTNYYLVMNVSVDGNLVSLGGYQAVNLPSLILTDVQELFNSEKKFTLISVITEH
jgi:hypothetical protein